MPAPETLAPVEVQPPAITHVVISEAELASGTMSPENIEAAIVALTEDGVVVLDDAVSKATIEALNPRMTREAIYLRDAPGTQFNYDVKAQNILQHMIPEPDYLIDDMHANPFALAVLQARMGPKPVLRYQKANTNFPGTSRQPVHSDVHYEHPRACFSLAVNIVLVDCSPENGGTECWLGTHNITNFKDQNGMNGIFPHLLDARRAIVPPVQATVKKGGIIIRDMRLWHAGMPNHTEDEVRVMCNLIYFADWYRCPMKIKMPPEARERIEELERKSGSQIAVEYVEGLNHLTLRHTHDFAQDDKKEAFGRNRE